MFFKPEELDPDHAVGTAAIQAACERAIVEARDLKAITRARDAVANALIDTLQEEFKAQKKP